MMECGHCACAAGAGGGRARQPQAGPIFVFSHPLPRKEARGGGGGARRWLGGPGRAGARARGCLTGEAGLGGAREGTQLFRWHRAEVPRWPERVAGRHPPSRRDRGLGRVPRGAPAACSPCRAPSPRGRRWGHRRAGARPGRCLSPGALLRAPAAARERVPSPGPRPPPPSVPKPGANAVFYAFYAFHLPPPTSGDGWVQRPDLQNSAITSEALTRMARAVPPAWSGQSKEEGEIA